MADRAAIVTGASSGIGLAVARMLAEEGHAVTMAARRPGKLERAYDELRADGLEVQRVTANVGDEDDIRRVVAAHRDAYGRLDVLMNNAGIGIGAPIGELNTKRLDIQLATNLRSIPLFYREALPLLTAAGAEHRNALVLNTSSLAGKQGEAWLSVYSATKFGVVGFTQSMNRELSALGIKSTALCPAFVDTDMTAFVRDHVAPEAMIQTSDLVSAVRMLLTLSPGCVVPEIVFQLPGGGQLDPML
ncbi:MAG TPA: SDR family oxidoreductase [Solirubrobacteraceae bacterium]|jgi:NAD(P)-dependent dehydrogenase (short-subunit alcohol dehydrogenase family)|nr:SDR family oxidoreductase [Solirubrobacteraceae bacterium]